MTNGSEENALPSRGLGSVGGGSISAFFMTYGAALLSAAAAFLVYLPALLNDFVNWDDEQYVYANPFIQSLDLQLLASAFTTFRAANWHPLTWLSHALDYAVWGLNPLGHHLTNILLHAANTYVVVLLAVTLVVVHQKRSKLPVTDRKTLLVTGLATGLLFGLHPLRVESVAWISERKDLLCAFFFLLSLMAYLKYAEGDDEDKRLTARLLGKWYLLVLFTFILALLSKPMAVTLPAVLLLADWYPLNRISKRTVRGVIAEKTPLMILSLASSILTIKAQSAGKAVVPLEAIPFATRVLVGIKALAFYLWKMIMPFSLSPFYPYPRNVNVLSPGYLFPVVVIFASIILCIVFTKKNRLWLAAWGYYLITLFPVLGFIQVGGQAMADRYSYLPSIVPTLLVGLGIAWLYERISVRGVAIQAVFFGVVATIVLSLTYLTESQIAKWKNSFVLWHYALEIDPQLALPHNNLALAHARRGETGLAIEHLRRAIELNPQWAVPYYNLANRYMDLGWNAKAIDELVIAITLFPQFAEAHNNLGILYASQGLLAEAVQQFQDAVMLQPDSEIYRNNLTRATRDRVQ